MSSATLIQNTEDTFGATGLIPVDDLNLVLSDSNTGSLTSAGNNTQYNKTFIWTPDMSAMIYKVSLVFATAMNISAFTTGTFRYTSLRVIIREWLPSQGGISSTVPPPILDAVFPTGHAGLTATGTQIFLLNNEVTTPGLKLHVGVPISVQITMTVTAGTGTRQEGIMPLFPFQVTNTTKFWTPSVIKFHVHPSLDHAFPVFRDQDVSQLLEYSPAFPSYLPQIDPLTIHQQQGHFNPNGAYNTNQINPPITR